MGWGKDKNKCSCVGTRLYHAECQRCKFPKTFYTHPLESMFSYCPSNIYDETEGMKLNSCAICSAQVCTESCSIKISIKLRSLDHYICYKCFHNLMVTCSNCENRVNRKKICGDRDCNNIICLDCYQEGDQCFKHLLLDNMNLAFPQLPLLVQDIFKHYIDKSI